MSHWRTASLSLTPAALARAANAWRKVEERDTFGSTAVKGGLDVSVTASASVGPRGLGGRSAQSFGLQQRFHEGPHGVGISVLAGRQPQAQRKPFPLSVRCACDGEQPVVRPVILQPIGCNEEHPVITLERQGRQRLVNRMAVGSL